MPTRATAQQQNGTTVAAEMPETDFDGNAVFQNAQMKQIQKHEENSHTDDADELNMNYYDPINEKMFFILEKDSNLFSIEITNTSKTFVRPTYIDQHFMITYRPQKSIQRTSRIRTSLH